MDSMLVAVTIASLLYLKRKRKLRWRNRKWWCRPINQRRHEKGDFENLFQELKGDTIMFFRYTRMNIHVFNKLLTLLNPLLARKSWRAINPECRLIITLRYLATGDQILSIALAYRIGESTANRIIQETCQSICDVLMPLYLRAPTEDGWREIIEGFLENWNFPNCLGAIDGKHVVIQAPPNSGSQFFNYKKTFSQVLMAACDYRYRFTLCDVGAFGSSNDGSIFHHSEFGQGIKDDTLNIPKGVANLPGSKEVTNCFFVGDDAFPLLKRLLKPFPGKFLPVDQMVFNYRLSRARRTIENAFGILVSRWRIYHKPICLNPNSVDKIIMATVCLHNFLMAENEENRAYRHIYCPPTFVDRDNRDGSVELGEWRISSEAPQGIKDLAPSNARNSTKQAYNQRDIVKTYLQSSEGKVNWQEEYVKRGYNKN